MKKIGIFIMLLIMAFVLTSCFDSDYSDSHHYSSVGRLKIWNDTNAPVTISGIVGYEVEIAANDYQIFEVEMKGAVTDPKGYVISYYAEGLYLHPDTHSAVVYEDETTVKYLDPDRGCINFNNNTDGYVYVSIPAPGHPVTFTINPNSYYIQPWLLEGSSGNATFTYSGDFVFEVTDDKIVYLNESRTYEINATGAAIKIRNLSAYSIIAVYLSLHSDTGWGDNDLSGNILPGNYKVWTVSPNVWDVKVVDALNYYSTWENNYFIGLNDMLVITYDAKKQPNSISHKIDGLGTEHLGQSRIQQVLSDLPVNK
jgi:hypothetical protein